MASDFSICFQSIVASEAAVSIIKGLCVTHLWHEAYSYLPFVNDDSQFDAIVEYGSRTVIHT